MVNYIFGDFIACLNNAKRQRFNKILLKHSNNLVINTLSVFQELNLIKNFYFNDDNFIEIELKYVRSKSPFKKLKLVSTPGRRIYYNLIELEKKKDKMNCSFFIVSTQYGLKTNFECM